MGTKDTVDDPAGVHCTEAHAVTMDTRDRHTEPLGICPRRGIDGVDLVVRRIDALGIVKA